MLTETALEPVNPLPVVAFTPDLRSLVANGTAGCSVWDVATGKQRWKQSWGEGNWLRAISRDSRWVAVARFRNTSDVVIFDVETGAERRSLFQHAPRSGAALLEFSPNGQLLAAAIHNQVHLWDLNADRLWKEPLRHLDRVISLDWSPDGSRLVTGSSDRTAHIWDVVTGQSLHEFHHEHDVDAVSFNPDGGIVATTDWESTRLWDAQTGQPLGDALSHQASAPAAVMFSPAGRWLFLPGVKPRLSPMPRPLELEGRQLRDWAEWMTGMRLGDDNVVRPLTAAEWQLRKQRVERAGIKAE
jgi:WD40 repeat protein